MKRFLYMIRSILLKVGIPIILVIGLLVLLNIFSLRYILVQAYGEVCILWNRIPLAEVARDERLTEEQRSKLTLVTEIQRFAGESLGLNVGRRYSQVSFAQNQSIYAVTAAYAEKLELYSWTFPIVGRVTYKGFFSREDADKQAAALQKEGFDVSVGKAGAFSTLGWFNDPILLHMLNWNEYSLAKTLFHELCHATLFVKGNSTFNESLATFVGNEGAFLFLESKYGKKSPQYTRAKKKLIDQEKFSGYINRMCGELETLFSSDLSRAEKLRERETVYRKYQTEYAAMGWQTDTFDYFPDLELNNAKLLGLRRYKRDLHLFTELFKIYKGNMGEMIQHLRTWVEYLEKKGKGENDIFKYMELVIQTHKR